CRSEQVVSACVGFLFSSSRRHTRSKRDWSSDVCSSDLRLIKEARENPVPGKEDVALYAFAEATDLEGELLPVEVAAVELLNIIRSEERRVGKECTSQKARGHWNKSPKGICTAAQTCCNE